MKKWKLTNSCQIINFEIIEGENTFLPCFKRPDVYPEAYDAALTSAFAVGRWVITSCGINDFHDGGAFTYTALQEKNRMLVPFSYNSCGDAIAAIFAGIHDAEQAGDLKVGRIEITHNADDLFGMLLTVAESKQKVYIFAEPIAAQKDADSYDELIYSCAQSIASACEMLNGNPIVLCEEYNGFCCKLCDPSDANLLATGCPNRNKCGNQVLFHEEAELSMKEVPK